MEEIITYVPQNRPTATALVGLSHRGSRVAPHAAAAMRQLYGNRLFFAELPSAAHINVKNNN